LKKTREAHTGNTIIKSYNGDGTIIWVQASERENTRPSGKKKENISERAKRTERAIVREEKIYRYTMHAHTAQE